MRWWSVVALACWPAMAGTFSDVPADHWAAPAIEEMVKIGVVQGTPEGQYHGDAAMGRYEFAAMAVRMTALAPCKLPEPEETLPFADVPASHWAAESIRKLVAAGVVTGTPDERFHGDNPLSRYDFAVMTQRLLKLFLGDQALEMGELEKPFADLPADHWASPAVRALCKHGVLEANPDEKFRGAAPLTRYDFATCGARLCRLILACRPAQ